MPQIIQFTHPGAEHGPDSPGGLHKSWNLGSHRRKFMRCQGDYVNGSNRLIKNKNLLFWGEWEPPSAVTSLGEPSAPFHPRLLHEPFLPAIMPIGRVSSCAPVGSSCKPACSETNAPQNTDPFVFDDAFKYLVCKQAKLGFRKSTGLTLLERGSMILFGSTSGRDKATAFFQLDTVFVIADWIEYSPSDLASLRAHQEVSGLYDQLVVSKAFPKQLRHTTRLRFYRGATYQNQVEGMYSFSPARVGSSSPSGFPRVRLSNLHFLTNNLNSAPKYTPAKPDPAFLAQVKLAWLTVRDETRRQGCVEGVRFSLPTVQKSPVPDSCLTASN